MYTFFVTDISIPPAIKKRGRPKGHELTTIDLPRKRTKTTEVKLQPFIKLHTSVKQRGMLATTPVVMIASQTLFTAMLKWFVDSDIASAVLQNPKKLIEEDDVEVHPANAVLDENVDIHLVRKFFKGDAWKSWMSSRQSAAIPCTYASVVHMTLTNVHPLSVIIV